jgi:hypothetical protein
MSGQVRSHGVDEAAEFLSEPFLVEKLRKSPAGKPIAAQVEKWILV